MIRFLIIAAVLLLIAGPLRKRLLAAWRFVVPAALGGIVGLVLAVMFVGTGGAPVWLIFVVPIIASLMIGSAGKKWIDDNIGPKGG